MEAIVFSTFLGGIVLCIVCGFDVLFALGFGVLCFGGYALWEGHSPRKIFGYMWGSLKSILKLLLTLFLIGAVTAAWRQSGTISFIVGTAVRWIVPRYFVLFTFLLCSCMGAVVGSSLCTCGTMGLILILMAREAGVKEIYVAGAALGGAMFGDRCSPMASSVNLVSSVTGSDVYTNVRRAMKTGAIPYLLTAAVYALIPSHTDNVLLESNIHMGFTMHWVLILPAVTILVLCFMKAKILVSLASSLGVAFILSVFVQDCSIPELLHAAILGFTPGGDQNPALAGGGAICMLHANSIIALSSTYLGIFRATRLKEWLMIPYNWLSRRLTRRGAAVVLSIPIGMFCCNQSMGILLLGELDRDKRESPLESAMLLSDSIVHTAALIPWNTCNAALCAAMGVGSGAAVFAVYLYLLPIVNALWRIITKKETVSH